MTGKFELFFTCSMAVATVDVVSGTDGATDGVLGDWGLEMGGKPAEDRPPADERGENGRAVLEEV
jgi:hypothetical protein